MIEIRPTAQDPSFMALSQFETILGGITSIPVLSGSIYLAYKAFGEKALDPGKTAKKKSTTTSPGAPAKTSAKAAVKAVKSTDKSIKDTIKSEKTNNKKA